MPSYAKHMVSFGLGIILTAWVLQVSAKNMVESNPTMTLKQYYFGGN